MYKSQGFIDTVKFCTNASMITAVEEIKSLPEYLSNGGEVMIIMWVITDARHDSTANAYHTTVPCLSGRYYHWLFYVL